MANELTITASLAFAKGNVPSTGLSISGKQFNVTGGDYQRATQEVPTTAGGTAIPLGGVTGALGWFFFKNNDSTNYITILSAASGTAFLRLYPGEIAMGRFDSGVTAPAALANSAVCQLEYEILPA